MNAIRRKSILILIATLFFGILLGLLVPAVIHKIRTRTEPRSGDSHRGGFHRKDRFVSTLQRVLQPDSSQAEQIKPVTEWAGARIDSIESSANAQVEAVFDSVSQRLAPFLSEDQQQRLDAFHQRARKNWNRLDGHRRR